MKYIYIQESRKFRAAGKGFNFFSSSAEDQAVKRQQINEF